MSELLKINFGEMSSEDSTNEYPQESSTIENFRQNFTAKKHTGRHKLKWTFGFQLSLFRTVSLKNVQNLMG